MQSSPRYDVRMGKYSGLAVITALLLTGCASGESEAAPTVTVTATPDAVEAKAIEVSSATPEAPPSETVDEEARYLKGVKQAWRTEVPTDADLLSAAALACNQLRAEANGLDLVTGGTLENNDWHSLQVAMLAGSTICPDALPGL